MATQNKAVHSHIYTNDYSKRKHDHGEKDTYFIGCILSCNSPVSIKNKGKIKRKGTIFYGNKWFKSYFQI